MEFLSESGRTWDEVLLKACEEVRRRGYVKPTYCEALIKREREYPTGLELGDVNVAIPHADVELVNEEALVAIVPRERVAFRRMDMPDREIPVDMIFLLLIKNPDGYVKFLSDLTTKFTDESFLDAIRRKDFQKLSQVLRELASARRP
ncbi:MAG: PTS sugar transporter subunit IIA [Desulfurococcaceae archaeon]